MMKKIVLGLLLAAGPALAQHADQVIPHDAKDVPIQTGLGSPYSTNGVTLTTGSYASWLTIPSTGSFYSNRAWKGIAIFNPSPSRTVFACLGNATGCTQDAMIVPPGVGVALDAVAFGVVNGVTTIWGRLDTTGSVTPNLTIW